MPRGPHVRLIIGVEGSCRIDAQNFADASCQAVTREITAALAGRVTHEHRKPEAAIQCRTGSAERERA